jgi:type IV pilus assembly protein PilO
MGAFASDVGKLSRIVTLNDIAMATGKDNALVLDATAKTFRYLDEDEVAAKKKATMKDKKGGKR